MKKYFIFKQRENFRGFSTSAKFYLQSLPNTDNTLALVKVSKDNPNDNQLSLAQKIDLQVQPVEIDFSNDTRINYFISCFFLLLGEVLDVQFEGTHTLFLNFVLEDFFKTEGAYFKNVSFNPNMIKAFTRNYARIKQKFADDLRINKRSVDYFKTKMSLQDFVNHLKNKIVNKQKEYLIYLKLTAVQNCIGGFNTLMKNLVWFMDITELKELGDGKNKSTGPGLLLITDMATKKIIHYKLFPSKITSNNKGPKPRPITSEDLIKEIEIAIQKNGKAPIFIHTDSDAKNRSPEYLTAILGFGSVPSLNRAYVGVLNDAHKNQVIENLNLHFQKYLAFLLDEAGFAPGSLQNESMKNKEYWVERTVIHYHEKKAHKGLSVYNFDYKNNIPITPHQADQSHELFSQLYYIYNTIIINKTSLHSSFQLLNNLDPDSFADQDILVDTVAKHIFYEAYKNGHEEVIKELFCGNNKPNPNIKVQQRFFQIFQIFFAYFLANSSNPRMRAFFAERFEGPVVGVKGPGRKRIFSEEFKQLMYAKQDFFKYFNLNKTLRTKIIVQMYKYTNFANNNLGTLVLTNVTAKQTRELKEHSETIAGNFKTEINGLTTEIQVLREKLNVFYEKQAQAQLNRDKKKNRKKRPITSAIHLSHFLKGLEIVKSPKDEKTAERKRFSCSRDRIALFLMYFSGMRVNELQRISYRHLMSMFYKESTLEIPVSKKRDDKDFQIFAISKPIKKKFVFDNYNLYDDFLVLKKHIDNYAKTNKIVDDKQYDLPFFSRLDHLHKAISRVSINNRMNALVREAVQASGNQKFDIKTFSSHSFRVNIITTLISRFGIRVAQDFVRHKSPITTFRYDRNKLTSQHLKNISNVLCINTHHESVHPDSTNHSSQELERLANFMLTNQDSTNLDFNSMLASNQLDEMYLSKKVNEPTSISQAFSNFEQEQDHAEQIQSIEFDELPVKHVNAVQQKKRLDYRAGGSKHKSK